MLNKHPSRTGTQTTVETPHMSETISDFEKHNELMSSLDLFNRRGCDAIMQQFIVGLDE
jgi:hypothetical protein